MRVGAIALGVVVLALVGFVAPVGAQTTSEAEQVLEQFERALNAYDEEGVARLFASDGAVRDNHTPGEVVSSAQLRGWVRRAGERHLHAHLGEYATRDGTTKFTIEVGQGEWFRTGETPRRGQGTAEVRGGRIVLLVLDPAAQTPTAALMANDDAPASAVLAPLGLGLTLALATVALARMRQRPPEASPSSAVGMLHAALGAWNAARRRDPLSG